MREESLAHNTLLHYIIHKALNFLLSFRSTYKRHNILMKFLSPSGSGAGEGGWCDSKHCQIFVLNIKFCTIR